MTIVPSAISLVRARRRVRVAAFALAGSLGGCSSPDTSADVHRTIRVVEPGVVYAGAAADVVDAAEIDALGIRTILDLDQENLADRRRVSRDHGLARERGALFVHLPLDPHVAPSLAELDAAVEILGERRFQPILVQADHSDHRTWLVVAAYRVRMQGWPPERAVQEMMERSRHGSSGPAWSARLAEYAAVHGSHAR